MHAPVARLAGWQRFLALRAQPAAPVTLPGRPAQKKKKHKTSSTRDEPIITAVASILNAGRSSKFEYMGAVTSGVRAGFCLEGIEWAMANARASGIVGEALRRLGAAFPSWAECQPSYIEEGAVAIGRMHCARCCTPLVGEPVAGRFCSDLCSAADRKVKHRRSGEAMSRAKYLASVAARRRALVRPCEHCGLLFEPRASTQRDRRFCSPPCWHAAIRQRPDSTECRTCGKAFVPDQPDRRYCSMPCYRISRRVTRPEATCPTCGGIFRPRNARNPNRFCSRTCASRSRKANDRGGFRICKA